MSYWLTSKNKKRHQRKINFIVDKINKAIENDNLWKGRFIIKQVHSPQWYCYEDGSGAELYVCLKCIDKYTGRAYQKWGTVNHWRGFYDNAYPVWDFMNWFIIEYCDIWHESLT